MLGKPKLHLNVSPSQKSKGPLKRLGLKINCSLDTSGSNRVRRSNSCGNLRILGARKRNHSDSGSKTTGTPTTPTTLNNTYANMMFSKQFNATFPPPKHTPMKSLSIASKSPESGTGRRVSKKVKTKSVSWATSEKLVQVFTYHSDWKYYERNIFYGFGQKNQLPQQDDDWVVHDVRFAKYLREPMHNSPSLSPPILLGRLKEDDSDSDVEMLVDS